jgi:gas vesicle protein
MSDNKTAKKLMIGAAVAGVAGYLAGILTAPKSGKETRSDIKENVNKGIIAAEKELKSLQSQLVKKIDEAKVYATKLTGKSREELDKVIAVAKAASDKARTVLSAVHEGDAEDADLVKAIKEANIALDHLKSYLKK